MEVLACFMLFKEIISLFQKIESIRRAPSTVETFQNLRHPKYLENYHLKLVKCNTKNSMKKHLIFSLSYFDKFGCFQFLQLSFWSVIWLAIWWLFGFFSFGCQIFYMATPINGHKDRKSVSVVARYGRLLPT